MKQKWKIWGLTLLLIIVSRESFWFGTYGNASLYTDIVFTTDYYSIFYR